MVSWFRIVAAAAAMLAAGRQRIGAVAVSRPNPCISWCRMRPAARSISWRARWAMRFRRNGASRSSSKTGPGAGGVIASQALVTSPPDGYTLIVVASGHPTNPFLYAKLPYDTFKDFTPISLLASSPNILLVRADSPFKTLADVIAAAKAKPGSLSYGHAGNGDIDASRRRALEESRQDRHRGHSL